ncbi:cytochrome c-type biogenesis protein [Geomicrobium halophilum]|uniref:Cytochrome c-type biogenesis protein n=1 Tax=Geomicrobium halophilum TaxID=549000 RepID=A0A841PTP2_9BACL|nr:cytochrome c biogenesis protein CcdA [Geomicrobium halophilum]MBB6449671.1 cytochrome c-type biogenesis protein [Geomicrobium halophilum]
MDDVSLGLAFAAGLISFFSPCIFPLLPAYLAQLTGTDVSSGAINADRRLIFTRSIGFILGFTIIFLLLGLSSTLIGSWFNQYSTAIMQIGGIIVILFGLQMTGIISIRALLTEKKVAKTPKKASSFSGSVLFGLVFAAGWTPCIGITLGSILTLAGASGSMLTGSTMLFVYSMGLGVPFIGVSLLYAKSFQKLNSINRFLPAIQKGSGVIMIILGILLFTGYFETIAMYLGQYVPSWMI